MVLSIVSFIRDRNDTLSKALPTWLDWAGCGEVIVFDQPVKERAYDVISQWFSNPKLKLVESLEENEFRLAQGRNTAFRASIGDPVLFLDADSMILPGMPENLLLEKGRYMHHVPIDDWGPLQGIFLVRRDDFLAVNGFDEWCIGWGYEDDDFCQRIERVLGLQGMHFPPFLKHVDHGNRQPSGWAHNRDLTSADSWGLKNTQWQFRCRIYSGGTQVEMEI